MIRSDFVSQFYSSQEIEQYFYSLFQESIQLLRWIDRQVRWISYEIRWKFWPRSSSSSHSQSSTKKKSNSGGGSSNSHNPAHHYTEQKKAVVIEDYLPEIMKFQFLKLSDSFKSASQSVLGLLKILSIELQRDLGMKEEEASLLILLTFFLVGLLGLQFCVYFLIRSYLNQPPLPPPE